MPSSRATFAACTNFLSALTSRNSDYQGYWVFGFIPDVLANLELDLLAPPPERPVSLSTPLEFLSDRAYQLFAAQMAKARQDQSQFLSADLRFARVYSDVQAGAVGNGSTQQTGVPYRCTVEVRTADERVISAGRTIYVAPLDPSVHRRSTRPKIGPDQALDPGAIRNS